MDDLCYDCLQIVLRLELEIAAFFMAHTKIFTDYYFQEPNCGITSTLKLE